MNLSFSRSNPGMKKAHDEPEFPLGNSPDRRFSVREFHQKTGFVVCSKLLTSLEGENSGKRVCPEELASPVDGIHRIGLALRLVSAAWIRGEQVAAHREGAGARASANGANRAASALSFQPGTIAQ